MKILRLLGALVLAISLMTFGVGAAFASEAPELGVDQRAELTLMPKVPDVEGTAELRLKIDEDSILELFRVRADAEGLVPGGTYSLVLGYHIIATGMADDGGKISFDETLDMFHKTCLKGVVVKIVYGDTIDAPLTLKGKVMAEDLE